MIYVLAQGHNAVTPVWLELAAPRARVKHSTTEHLNFATLCHAEVTEENTNVDCNKQKQTKT